MQHRRAVAAVLLLALAVAVPQASLGQQEAYVKRKIRAKRAVDLTGKQYIKTSGRSLLENVQQEAVAEEVYATLAGYAAADAATAATAARVELADVKARNLMEGDDLSLKLAAAAAARKVAAPRKAAYEFTGKKAATTKADFDPSQLLRVRYADLSNVLAGKRRNLIEDNNAYAQKGALKFAVERLAAKQLKTKTRVLKGRNLLGREDDLQQRYAQAVAAIAIADGFTFGKQGQRVKLNDRFVSVATADKAGIAARVALADAAGGRITGRNVLRGQKRA